MRSAALLATLPGMLFAQSVGILVAPFDGPAIVGVKAATVLNLQVWQTLRLAPPNNVHRLSFGRGTVYWDEGAPVRSHAEAEKRADRETQLVFWGRAQPYGSGDVVTAYLTVVGATHPGLTVWKVARTDAGSQPITAALPARRFEFAPIVLTPEVLSEFQTPGGLKMYRSCTSREESGIAGDSFTALEQGPDCAKIRSGGVDGWVRLPGLSRNRSEVVDFVGAMVRIFRKDWGGALDLFERVVANSAAPASIRAQAFALMAAASDNLSRQTGMSSRRSEFVEKAVQLNPYLQSTIRYLCMSQLADIEGARAAERAVHAASLRETIARYRFLFSAKDPWLANVESAATAAR